jgi:hypothetical protein
MSISQQIHNNKFQTNFYHFLSLSLSLSHFLMIFSQYIFSKPLNATECESPPLTFLIPLPNKSYNGVGSGIIFFKFPIPIFSIKNHQFHFISFHSFRKEFSTFFIKQKKTISFFSFQIRRMNNNLIDNFCYHPMNKLHHVLQNKKQHTT